MRDWMMTVFNMSVTASLVMALVLPVRLLLKKSPKSFPMHCGQWFCSGCCVPSQ